MFNGLNNKQTNGGVNASGKLTSAEWNNFIDELISELEKRASNILINSIRHTASSHQVNLGDIVRSVKVNGVTVAAQNDGIINLDLSNFYTKSQIDSMMSGLAQVLTKCYLLSQETFDSLSVYEEGAFYCICEDSDSNFGVITELDDMIFTTEDAYGSMSPSQIQSGKLYMAFEE